jgi:hypothetical protein
VLSYSEEEIREMFPKGAVKVGAARWRPALDSKGADRTLKRLLRDKAKRMEPHRLLGAGSGYVKEPKYALGIRTRHPGEFGEPEPEAVDEATQAAFSKGARDNDTGAEVTVSMERLEGERQGLRAQLDTYRRLAEERGVNIRSDLRVVERRLEELDRKLGVRRAA